MSDWTARGRELVRIGWSAAAMSAKKAPPSRKEREKGRAPAFVCGERVGQPPARELPLSGPDHPSLKAESVHRALLHRADVHHPVCHGRRRIHLAADVVSP